MKNNIIEQAFPIDFISPEHISEKSQKSMSSGFSDSDIGLVRIDNFLCQETATRCQAFLTDDAEYGELHGYSNSNKPTLDKKEWLAASESERFFCYEMLEANNSNNFNFNALSFLKLRHFFESNTFKHFVQAIIQRTLGDVTPVRVHRMRTGHFLKRHSDRGRNRDIAFILYLSSNWQNADGGNLHIISQNKREHVIEPVHNRLLIFDVHQHKHHYLSEINIGTAEGLHKCRLSINGWFQKHSNEPIDNQILED
jgi:Rps23 Pro-64 3,4-dihydroxylase Tpa1-like proline 4-hydroxylase